MRLGYLDVMDDAQTILAHKADLYKKHGLKEVIQASIESQTLNWAITEQDIQRMEIYETKYRKEIMQLLGLEE
jgi:hypothetical protein